MILTIEMIIRQLHIFAHARRKKWLNPIDENSKTMKQMDGNVEKCEALKW